MIAHIVLSLEPGGMERFVCDLACCPELSDVPATVYCLDERGRLAEQVEQAGGRVVLGRRRPGIDIAAILRLASFLRKERVAVAHTHSLDAMFYTAFASFLAGTPVRIHTQHNTFLDTSVWKDRMKFRLASRFFTTLAGVSRESRNSMLRAGALPGRTIAIPNGIDTARYRHSERHPDAGSLVIGTVARLSPEKGIDVLLQAFARVRRSLPAALFLVGDGPERQELERIAGELGVADAVHFHGYTPHVAEALARMDLFVLPSRSEGIPLALLEAMASGLPVVATRVGGVPEVVADGMSGLLVPPDDVFSLAAAMETMLRDTDRRRRAGELGRTCVRTEFSHERMARSYRMLYSHNPEPWWRESLKRATRLLPRRALCWSGSELRPSVAVTFDDGPDPVYTPVILSALRRYRARATFFLVGERASRYPDLVKRIADEGHEIGNHSFSHPDFARLSVSEALVEIDRTEEVLGTFQIRPCRLFRPPKGKLCLSSLAAAWLRGLTVTMWSVDPRDFAARDSEEIHRATVLKPVRSGDIVLYHGLTDAAAAGLHTVLETAAAAGRQLVTVSEIAGFTP